MIVAVVGDRTENKLVSLERHAQAFVDEVGSWQASALRSWHEAVRRALLQAAPWREVRTEPAMRQVGHLVGGRCTGMQLLHLNG